MTCKDCYFFEACNGRSFDPALQEDDGTYSEGVEKECHIFKDKSRIIELPCKVGILCTFYIHK